MAVGGTNGKTKWNILTMKKSMRKGHSLNRALIIILILDILLIAIMRSIPLMVSRTFKYIPFGMLIPIAIINLKMDNTKIGNMLNIFRNKIKSGEINKWIMVTAMKRFHSSISDKKNFLSNKIFHKIIVFVLVSAQMEF